MLTFLSSALFWHHREHFIMDQLPGMLFHGSHLRYNMSNLLAPLIMTLNLIHWNLEQLFK